MADVKISGLTHHRPVDENVLFVGSWKDGESYKTYSSTGNEFKKFVLSYIKAGDGIKIDQSYMGLNDNDPCYITIKTDLDLSLYNVVDVLPNSGQTNKIYLVKDSAGVTGEEAKDNNQYIEYAWVNNTWEKIGEYQTTVNIAGELTDYYKKSEVQGLIQSATNDMATQTWVSGQNYLKEHQSLTDYAKTATVTEELAKKVNKEDVKIEAVDGAADKKKLTLDADKTVTVLTEHQDLTAYATTDSIKDMATKTWVGQQDYADKNYVTQQINNAKFDEGTLDAYATKEEVEAIKTDVSKKANSSTTLAGYDIEDAKFTNHTDSDKVNITLGSTTNAVLTSHQSLDSYATKEYVDSAIEDVDVTDQLEGLVKSAEIADMATKTWVNSEGFLKDHQSLTEYAKTTEVEGLIAASEKKIFGDGELATAFDTIKEIGDYLKDHDDVAKTINEAITKKADKSELTGLATETYVGQQIEALNVAQYETITGAASKYQAKGNYLTEVPAEYAKKSDVESAVANKANSATTLAGYGIEDAKFTNHDDSDKVNITLGSTTNAVLTSHQSLAGYATTDSISDMATKTWVNNQNFATTDYVSEEVTKIVTGGEVELKGYAKESWVNNKIDELNITQYAKTADLDKYALATALKDATDKITELEGKLTALTNKLAKYDERFGYPTTDTGDWTKSFLLIDEA